LNWISYPDHPNILLYFFESPTFEVSWVYINYVNCLLEAVLKPNF